MEAERQQSEMAAHITLDGPSMQPLTHTIKSIMLPRPCHARHPGLTALPC